MSSGVDLDINRWTYEPPVADGTLPPVLLFRGARSKGSHTNVCFFVSCDASVRGSTFASDSEVHWRLGTRSELKHADLPAN